MIQHFLDFRARVNPDSLAICTTDRAATFAQLRGRVRAAAAALRQRGLPPGGIVVTCIAEPALDWVLTLAIHHEGLVSCSSPGYTPIEAFSPDLLITDRPLAHADPARTLVLDAQWLQSLPAPPANLTPRPFGSADAPVRLRLTSGTTGQRKAVAMAEGALLDRTKARALVFEPEHILTPMPMSTGIGFNNALLALMRGTPLYVARSSDDALALIEQRGIQLFYGSPAQILGVVRAAAAKGSRPRSLTVVKSTGAPLSEMLIRGVRQWLCPTLVNQFGACETGAALVCLPDEQHDAAVIGHVIPGCEVQVVDEQHQPLPAGVEGAVRVRTPYMAQGYLGAPELSAQSFRDGFFYSGDRGYWADDGQLVLAGRTSEIINRGGVKIDPAMIDRIMLEQPHVSDAAAFAAPGPGGLQEVAAAVVVTEGFDAAAFRAALHQRLGATREPKAILRMSSIPRSPEGKVLRQRLADVLLSEAGKASATGS